MNAVVELNPFQSAHRQREQNAVAESTSQREVSEIQSAMVIAKRFPRDPVEAMDRILAACTRPTLAEGALYSYSRGGADVTGPSIRLAESLAQLWGNVHFGIRELNQTKGESTVEAFAFDLETNTRQVKVFQVPHIRYTRAGAKKLEDPRDVYELVANQGARRLRACILGIIPGDVVEAAVKQCETTLHTSADVSPEKLQAMVNAFETSFGVTKDMIQKRIGRRIDAITPALLIQLKKIFQSLKDDMSKPSDWFEGAAEATKKTGLSVADLKAASVNTSTGEIMTNEPDAYEDLRQALSECKTISDLTRLIGDLSPEQKADETLMGIVRERQAEIKG